MYCCCSLCKLCSCMKCWWQWFFFYYSDRHMPKKIKPWFLFLLAIAFSVSEVVNNFLELFYVLGKRASIPLHDWTADKQSIFIVCVFFFFLTKRANALYAIVYKRYMYNLSIQYNTQWIFHCVLHCVVHWPVMHATFMAM